MPRSEIDDIFAAHPKPAPSQQPSNKQPQKKPRREKKHPNTDNGRFRDSRGSAPRRKTDDGYNIYKEDELGISTTGGDTPLCPFDCQCCF